MFNSINRNFKRELLKGLNYASLGVLGAKSVPAREEIEKLLEPEDLEVGKYCLPLQPNHHISALDIFYPLNIDDLQKLPIVIVGHGWLRNKNTLLWLGELLAAKKMLVGVFTASHSGNPFVAPSKWKDSFIYGVEQIRNENANTSAPFFDKLDINSVNIIGHSMGGGGSLYFGDEQIEGVSSIIALAPFEFSISKPGDKNNIPTLICSGVFDMVAPPNMGRSFYYAIDENKEKCFLNFSGANHLSFEWLIVNNHLIAGFIIEWLRIYALKDKSQAKNWFGVQNLQNQKNERKLREFLISDAFLTNTDIA